MLSERGGVMTVSRHLSMQEVLRAAESLADKIIHYNGSSVRTVYGVPRGGIPAALAVVNAGNRRVLANRFQLAESAHLADLIVDDLVDSGTTRASYHRKHEKPFAALFTKREADDVREHWMLYGDALESNEWVVFPWELTEERSAEDAVVRLLQFIGEEPSREGLRETPARAIKAWREWTAGYGVAPEQVLKSFEDGATGYDEMVLVKDIPVYSHCEHHLAPFFGVAHVAYIPNVRILGLSKVSRLVDIFARRLQVQERMTVQIADALNDALEPRGVAVMVQCRHLCMESRGVSRRNLVTVTTALRGCMKQGQARDEFLETINAKGAV